MKKVRAYITVDLNVSEELSNKDIETLIAVGKYQQNLPTDEDVILMKDEDFEVEEYVDIEVKDHKDIPFIKK